ncbi:hypothetical protein [Haloferula sp. A504]|uniref:hypothetical protein n=1 Tax=Haloferula sp. A504 TaxID=3373601 RepID=UPI0031C52A02|nr:hypothetical protein [Verrucomicrobiaceae bacterium E54]
MKTGTPLPVRVFSTLIAGLIALASPATGSNQGTPTGWITATPGVVKAGTLPTLKWKINHPAVIKDYVDIDPPGVIIPREKLRMEIRVLGAGVTSGSGSRINFVYTESWFSLNNGGWDRLFAGDNWDVRQDRVVHSGIVNPGASLRFGGRFWWNNKWSEFYHSNDGTTNVNVLTNGDEVPTTYSIESAPTLEDFIKPYLDAGGNVRIGPMDCIVMMELTHTQKQRNNLGYDLQDMVLLITFEPI